MDIAVFTGTEEQKLGERYHGKVQKCKIKVFDSSIGAFLGSKPSFLLETHLSFVLGDQEKGSIANLEPQLVSVFAV